MGGVYGGGAASVDGLDSCAGWEAAMSDIAIGTA